MRKLFVLFIFLINPLILKAQSLDVVSKFIESSSGNRSGFSSPAVGDLDSNPDSGKEIVAASINGTISAFSSLGSLLWEAYTPDAGCVGGRSDIHSSPAIAKLYGDGLSYVIIGYGNIKKRCSGGVLVLNGSDGSLKWNFSTTAFAKKEKFYAFLHTVFSSPAVADTDGDGKMEIGFGSFDRNVYLLNYDGTIRWYYQAADTVWSSPTFANIDSTPQLELIAATDITQNFHLNPKTYNGGNLYAFKTARNPKKVYRFRDKNAFLWMKPMEQVLFSSPKVAEVDPNNPGVEIVINSGCYFPERTNQKVGKWTRVISGKTGKILRTLPIEACSSSSPALQDVNGDGEADIFVSVNGSSQIGGDGKSKIKAFDGATGNLMWSIEPYFQGRNYEYGGNFISPKVTSIRSDGVFQVFVPVHSGIGVYDANTGTEHISCGSSCSTATSLKTSDVILNTPQIDDINLDGTKDLVVAGKNGSSLGVYAWTLKGFK